MAKTKRDEELSGRKRIAEKLQKIFDDIEKGFADQRGRSDDLLDYWDVYNSRTGDRQFYSGNSKVYVPIVRNAIEARKTRFTNQMFPQSGRYVEVTTENDEIPHATMALLEFYVRQAKLRTEIIPALCVTGDVEGQYSIYTGWRSYKRNSVSRETKPVTVGDLGEFPELGTVDKMKEEDIEVAGPYAEIILDSDLLVLPATCDNLDECIDAGGSVTIIRRWSKQKIKDMIADGEFTSDVGDALLDNMSKRESPSRTDTRKELADAAGIKVGQGGKFCQGYEVWTKLKVDGEMRLCRAYYGGESLILGVKLCPYWNDRQPVISAPVRKMPGVFKGRSPVSDVIDLQILANDMTNVGADTAFYSGMPIIMTDPEKNPRYQTMVMGLAAVWGVDPNSTKFAQFPELWKHSWELVQACEGKIMQTLGVNPSMIAQDVAQKQKKSQAEIANAQQVDILTTADAVTVIEEGILTPLLQRFAEYDHQFREDEITVRVFGDMGLRAKMEEIPLMQINRRYEFRWFGVEAARNAMQIQQQIALLNVLKGIPPQMYAGYELKLSPVLSQIVENVFGPRMSPLLFVDMKKQLSVDPELENQMLAQTFAVPVHPMDDDQQHLQVHMQLLQGGLQGDPSGNIRAHVMGHQQQMQMKAQAAQMQQMQKGQPGGPGGAGPGVAGTPSGAQPGKPRQKGANGAIPMDHMTRAGAVPMPRKM